MTPTPYDALEPCFEAQGRVKTNLELLDGELAAMLSAKTDIGREISADRAIDQINRAISKLQGLRSLVREVVKQSEAA